MFETIAQIDRIRASNNRAELSSNFQISMTELGFEWCNISIAKNMADADYEMLSSNWPEIIRLKFHQKTNSDAAFTSQLPPAGMNFTWDESTFRDHQNDSFISVLIGHGIKTGAFVSLSTFNNRPYKLVLGSRSLQALSSETVTNAIILATVTLMRLDSLGHTSPAVTHAGGSLDLTETQGEILHWAAQGKSNADIASIMGLSTSAVSYHLARIYKILGVATKLQAVALLTSSGAQRAH